MGVDAMRTLTRFLAILLAATLLIPSVCLAQDAVKRKKGRKAGPKVDPNLPSVLIIGDSISMGYTPYVVKELAGKANVIHAPGNSQGTTLGCQKLGEWLKCGEKVGIKKWDVIHFNWGLHDLKHVTEAGTSKNSNDFNDPQQADITQYEKNLKVLVKQLKATGVPLIFATTTPYPDGVKPARKPSDAPAYNEVATKIMKANDIKVNDLYALVLPKLAEVQRPKNVHFAAKGSELMGKQVAEHILQALPK
jgi:acyl-CoA thioesterase-1